MSERLNTLDMIREAYTNSKNTRDALYKDLWPQYQRAHDSHWLSMTQTKFYLTNDTNKSHPFLLSHVLKGIEAGNIHADNIIIVDNKNYREAGIARELLTAYQDTSNKHTALVYFEKLPKVEPAVPHPEPAAPIPPQTVTVDRTTLYAIAAEQSQLIDAAKAAIRPSKGLDHAAQMTVAAGIAAVNGLQNLDDLRQGQVLTLPTKDQISRVAEALKANQGILKDGVIKKEEYEATLSRDSGSSSLLPQLKKAVGISK